MSSPSSLLSDTSTSYNATFAAYKQLPELQPLLSVPSLLVTLPLPAASELYSHTLSLLSGRTDAISQSVLSEVSSLKRSLEQKAISALKSPDASSYYPAVAALRSLSHPDPAATFYSSRLSALRKAIDGAPDDGRRVEAYRSLSCSTLTAGCVLFGSAGAGGYAVGAVDALRGKVRPGREALRALYLADRALKRLGCGLGGEGGYRWLEDKGLEDVGSVIDGGGGGTEEGFVAAMKLAADVTTVKRRGEKGWQDVKARCLEMWRKMCGEGEKEKEEEGGDSKEGEKEDLENFDDDDW